MIRVNNLRREVKNDWVYLIADISCDNHNIDLPEKHIWFSVPENHSSMFDNSYNAFLLVPYFLSIYYSEDLYIEGSVSHVFYFNTINFIRQIFLDFCGSNYLGKLHVDRLAEEKVNNNVIGASCSCGVDSLCTIFDRYENEQNQDYKINTVFFFNCGTHGDYNDTCSRELWRKRFELNKRAADELNLPIVEMDSNIHAFTHSIYRNDEPIGYLAIYSCILALGGKIKKYYVSSEFSYAQTLSFGTSRKNIDISGFNGMALIPLIKTENTELVLDGAQYLRSEKLVHISNWDIAHRYLNVCINPLCNGENCSTQCYKCRTSLLILDSINCIDSFKDVFDLTQYKAERYSVQCECMLEYKVDPYVRDAVDFVTKRGSNMPTKIEVLIYRLKRKITRVILCRRDAV